MEVFLNHDDWNDHYGSAADYVATNQPRNGAEFTLVKATVYTATTYRMVDGVPTPTTIHLGAELA